MAVINGLLNDPRNFQARRLLNQLEEPARTRAQFYLGQRLTKVGRNVATQEDMNLAIGRPAAIGWKILRSGSVAKTS